MKNLFSFIVVVLVSVVFMACDGSEYIETEPATVSTKTVEVEKKLNWAWAGSQLVKNETTLEDGVVDFTIAIRDSFVATYGGEMLTKDSVRTYKFSEESSVSESWRNINISFSKGFKYFQKEFTNHINLKRSNYAVKDTVDYNYNGWRVKRENKEVHFNLQSTSSSEDILDPVATSRSFWGIFMDPEERLSEAVELNPVMIKTIFNGFTIYHHKDETYAYDETTSTWTSRPWETGEDRQSSTTIKQDSLEYMRYPIVVSVKFTCAEFNLSEVMNSEYDYWVAFNEEEALAEGTAVK